MQAIGCHVIGNKVTIISMTVIWLHLSLIMWLLKNLLVLSSLSFFYLKWDKSQQYTVGMRIKQNVCVWGGRLLHTKYTTNVIDCNCHYIYTLWRQGNKDFTRPSIKINRCFTGKPPRLSCSRRCNLCSSDGLWDPRENAHAHPLYLSTLKQSLQSAPETTPKRTWPLILVHWEVEMSLQFSVYFLMSSYIY